MGGKRLTITKTELARLYPRLTIAEIAAHYGCGDTVIFNRLKQYGIAMTKKHRHPISETHRAAMSAAHKGKPGKKKGREAKCEICGKPFWVIPAREGTARFCSNACRGEWRSKNMRGSAHPRFIHDAVRSKRCVGCGIEMVHSPPNTIANFLKQRFCTKECADRFGLRYRGEAHPLFKGDLSRRRSRPASMARWAEKVLRRDKWTCVRCGAASPDVELQAHHVKTYEDFPDERTNVANGVTLCAPCHWDVHTTNDPRFLFTKTRKPKRARPKVEAEGAKRGTVFEGKQFGKRQVRKWRGACCWCGIPIEKRLSDVTGKRFLFCGYSCAAKHSRAFFHPRKSTTPIPPTAVKP